MSTKKPTIGFIGQGYIGKNYADDFERRGYAVVRYALEEPYVRNKPALAGCDVVFVAVPTPTTPEGFDDSIVRAGVALAAPGSVVVIKSTMIPGTTEKIQGMFPDRFVVYSPEFLIARNAAYDAAHPFMNVIGIPKDTLPYRAVAEHLLSIFPESPYKNVCHSTEAEFIKYTHNTLGYIKIIWINMLHDALSSYGKEWAPIREAIEHDPMITKYYNDPVHQSGRGAGGACFIKDYAAFAALYKNLFPHDTSGHKILDGLEQKNIELLTYTNKDMDLLRGVYGDRIQQPSTEKIAERVDKGISVETYGRKGFGILKDGQNFSQDILEKLSTRSRIALSDRELCDLELLLTGGFAPLSGFMDEADYVSVVETMRLKDGTLFPIPIILSRPKGERHTIGEQLVLTDVFGNPIAFMTVTSMYTPDKQKEAKEVYGTTDRLHPGVRYLFDEVGEQYLGGPVEKIMLPPRYDFRHLRKTPAELKHMFLERGWQRIIGFQTRNPLQKAHVELMRRAAASVGGRVLLHPVVGVTKEGDIDYLTRVRAYQRVRDAHMSDFAELALLPLAMRMAGPREALWHAVVRKNHGCTHFIVGRDHAGPGKDSTGVSFYAPEAAAMLAKSLEKDLGITIIPSSEIVFHETKGYVSAEILTPEDEKGVKRISGTELRRRLRAGEDVPEWFAHSETIDELKKGMVRERRRGAVVFFTGLSGAGKSTIAHLLAGKLREMSDREVTILDGDVVRHHLSKGLGFSREDRDANIERIGFVAGEIAKHGGIAICSAIAPYQAPREKNRELVERDGSAYIEVYIATPIAVCRARDTKGLYKKADAGLLKGFTGVDDPYEPPSAPEVRIDTSTSSPEEAVESILSILNTRGKL